MRRIWCRTPGCCPRPRWPNRIGLGELIEARLRLARHGANAGTKAMSVIGSMLAGGDCIDDVAVLRAGAATQLFDVTRAPSTVGSSLRGHKWSNVRQLDVISRQLLARLWAAGAGPADLAAPLNDRPGLHHRGGARAGQAGWCVRLHQGPRLPPAAGHLRADRAGALRPDARRLGRGGPGGEELPDRDGQPHPGPWQPIPYWLSTPEVSGAHNVGRAIGVLAGPDLARATAATLRRRVFAVPGRLVRTGRRRHPRLPASWPWAEAIGAALTRIQALPLRC